MKTKIIGIALVLAAASAVWLAVVKTDNSANPTATQSPVLAAAPTFVDGKQVLEVFVKDGYQPTEIDAKAGVPTVLKMKTQATFDCSTEFTIPQLGVRVHLESTGETAIDIPAQKAGDSIYGVCGMGMNKLEIQFN